MVLLVFLLLCLYSFVCVLWLWFYQCLRSWTCACGGANSGCVSIAVFVLVFLLPVKVMWYGCSEEQRFILCLSLCSCVCWSQRTRCTGSWLEGVCVFVSGFVLLWLYCGQVQSWLDSLCWIELAWSTWTRGSLGCGYVCVFAFLYVATPTTRAQRGCVPVLLKEAGARAAVALCRRPAGRYLRGPLYWPASEGPTVLARSGLSWVEAPHRATSKTTNTTTEVEHKAHSVGAWYQLIPKNNHHILVSNRKPGSWFQFT